MRAASFLLAFGLALAACTTDRAGPVAPASTSGVAADTASAPSSSPPDGGALPDELVACTADSDCVAVDRAGCCHNGWKEAVLAQKADAYADAYKCTQPGTLCTRIMVRDLRVPKCDATSKKCVMATASP